jgi:hypothetical protein
MDSWRGTDSTALADEAPELITLADDLGERLRDYYGEQEALGRIVATAQARDAAIAQVLAERARNAEFHTGDAWAFALLKRLLDLAPKERRRARPTAKPRRAMTSAQCAEAVRWILERRAAFAAVGMHVPAPKDHAASLQRAERDKVQKLSGRISAADERREVAARDVVEEEHTPTERLSGYGVAHLDVTTQLEIGERADELLDAQAKLRKGLRALDSKKAAAVEHALKDAKPDESVPESTQRSRRDAGMAQLGERLGVDVAGVFKTEQRSLSAREIEQRWALRVAIHKEVKSSELTLSERVLIGELTPEEYAKALAEERAADLEEQQVLAEAKAREAEVERLQCEAIANLTPAERAAREAFLDDNSAAVKILKSAVRNRSDVPRGPACDEPSEEDSAHNRDFTLDDAFQRRGARISAKKYGANTGPTPDDIDPKQFDQNRSK